MYEHTVRQNKNWNEIVTQSRKLHIKENMTQQLTNDYPLRLKAIVKMFLLKIYLLKFGPKICIEPSAPASSHFQILQISSVLRGFPSSCTQQD